MENLMIISVVLFMSGWIYALIINANTPVQMSSDLWDLPLKIKMGFLISLVGIICFIICTMMIFIKRYNIL